jgi:hypothetical protein
MGLTKYFATPWDLNTKFIPKQNFIRKLVTYTIAENADEVKLYLRQEQETLHYDNCSFNNGIFTFKGNEDSNPLLVRERENNLLK